MVRRQIAFRTGVLILLAAASTLCSATAKTKAKLPAPQQDQIDIVANMPVNGGPITRFTMTRHINRSYLYIEHATHVLTLVDVTDAHHPTVVANLDLPSTGSGSVVIAAGDAALVSSDAPAADPVNEKTMTIVSFADRAHPQTIRQFNKVTCTAVDNQRDLVFVANDQGLWILHRNPAEDSELQERYAHEVLYNH
jgi:hypothetical protein